MKRFEFVTRCDTCGRIIKSEHCAGKRAADKPLIVATSISVPGIDMKFRNSRDYGDMCRECYDTVLLPELKKLQNIPNMHVTVKNGPLESSELI